MLKAYHMTTDGFRKGYLIYTRKKFGADAVFPTWVIQKYFLVHYDLFTNNQTSMLSFQIILHRFKKLNKFFKRFIIYNNISFQKYKNNRIIH